MLRVKGVGAERGTSTIRANYGWGTGIIIITGLVRAKGLT